MPLHFHKFFQKSEKMQKFAFFPVGGLMNGSIKVFSAITGNLAGILESEETLTEAMPISRIKCKPNAGGDNPILAATYVSGHLRLWNYANGQCVSQVCSLHIYSI